MARRIFISKNASEVVDLDAFLKSQGDQLISHSFLQYTQIEIEPEADEDDSFDVIFFGSPRAVFFFKSQIDIPVTTEIACVGGKTAEIIRSINRDVAFEGSGSIQDIAKEFKAWCGSKKVLFPLSSISLKTIASGFPDSQKIEVEVYDTTIVGHEISTCDIYVFTSPSNVKGFFEKNQIPTSSTVIAWGESTRKALQDIGQEPNHTLVHSSLEELQQFLTV